MAVRTLKKTVVVDKEVNIPDHFGDDESVRGQIVDALLALDHFHPRGRGWPREDIWSDDFDVVNTALDRLETYYRRADAVIEIARAHKDQL